MHSGEVQELIYDVASIFFQGATVFWTEQIVTKPPLPYVTLKLGNINRNLLPLESAEGDRYYHCSTVLEINVYTKGRKLEGSGQVTVNYENTATQDLMDFCNYIDSSEITDHLTDQGMDMLLMPPVRDLTSIENDSKFRYRAMAEFSVQYAEEANGLYGVMGIEMPTPSGGGNPEIAGKDIYVIDNVEIEEGEN